MTIEPRIAIDAMGGDEGVSVMIAGAALARRRHERFRFILFGNAAQIAAALDNHPNLRAASEIVHCDDVVTNDDKPSQAIRKKKSSMAMAINAVKSGEAQAAVSGGNTGALMAMSKLSLRTMKGIDRPALTGLIPTRSDFYVAMLDLGANTECDARNLVQFAVMGAAYSRLLYGEAQPSVALLNIGTEDQKGTESIREAAQYLRDHNGLSMDFQGYIEADKIARGDIRVVVSDGFSGNVALKAIEGTARFVTDLLKDAFRSSIRSMIGYRISQPATELLRHRLDPNNYNGAVMMGLNGVVVKSHGSADAKGVANAVAVAARLVEEDITSRIARDLEQMGMPTAPTTGAAQREDAA